MKKSLTILISFLFLAWASISWTPVGKNIPQPLTLIKSSAAFIDNNTSLYDVMNLSEAGLSRTAFEIAAKGFQKLVAKKKISASAYLVICDFSQSSRRKRFYIVDMENKEVVFQTFVAHGKNSGAEYATRFSNRSRSLQSSLGFYITDNTYFGEHGLSLRIRGLEPGFNDKALQRNIVVHGADYLEESWVNRNKGAMGRSFGCPAVPKKESAEIINTIKNGNCIFIYHPSKNYLKGSKILNG